MYEYPKALDFFQQALAISLQTKKRDLEAYVLNSLGDISYKSKDFQKAIEYYQQSLAAAKESKDKDTQARSLETIGDIYHNSLKDDQKALGYYQQALTIARESKNRDREKSVLFSLAQVYKSQKNEQQAIDYHRQAVLINLENLKLNCESNNSYALGAAYEYLMKDYPKALSYYQQALEIARKANKRDCELMALEGTLDTYDDLKDYRKVIVASQQALVIAREIKDRESEFKILAYGLAKAYNSLQDYPKAIEYYQQAVAVARTTQKRDIESKLLSDIGDIYHDKLEEYAKAVEYYQQSLSIAQEINNRPYQLPNLTGLALASYHLKSYQKAIEYFQQALALAQDIKDYDKTTNILINLANTFHELKDDQKAIAYYKQSLQVAQESKDKELERSTLIRVGWNHGINLGDWQQSLEYFQQALAIARETKNRQGEGEALWSIGNAYIYTGNLPQGIELTQQALVASRETHDLEHEGWSLGNLAAAHMMQGDLEKALELSQQSLAIARGERSTNGQTFKSRDLEGLSLVILGVAYEVGRNDYRKAFELEQQGLVMAREAKNRFLESFALSYLSTSYQERSEYPKAIETAEQSLAIAREINLSMAELIALFNLGNIYGSLGDYPKAISFYEQALAIAKQTQNQPMEGMTLLMLGDIYDSQGNDQKTIELAQQAAVVFEASKSPLMKSLALGVLSTGYAGLQDYPKAIATTEESLTIARSLKNRGLESGYLGGLGYLYRKSGKLQQAISFYQAALATNPTPELPGSGSAARHGLARAYRSLNMPTTAIAYYKQAVSGVEQVRQKIQGLPPQLQNSFLYSGRKGETTADVYRELADLLLSQGRILEAQDILELLKVQEIRDFTKTRGKTPEVGFSASETQIKQADGSLIALGQQIYQCQQVHCPQLSQLLDQRDTLTKEFNQKIQSIEQEVRSRRAQDEGFFDPSKVSKLKAVVEAQPGTVLIYPLVLEDKIWLVWAAQGGIVKTTEVGNVKQQQLRETVLKFRQLLARPSSSKNEVKATGKQLYDWLIKPLEPELKHNKIHNLVFALDRVTRYIPMSALFDGEKYLIENYTVSTVLSADLTDTRDRIPPGTQSTSVLALGLSNSVAGFPALPNVPAELDAIVRKQPNNSQGIYPGLEFLNRDFNFRALRDNLPGHQLLHIATHGEFVPGSPDASYLLLGTGEKLAIPEIATLQDLSNVQLVVLSACKTALGKEGQDGNEINGISYYFLNSGAKAVMASLWSVNDDSTRVLMQNFYGNLAKGTATTPITKAEALRQAQLSLLNGNELTARTTEQRSSLELEARLNSSTTSTSRSPSSFSHPYYWAPFILIGNGL